MGEAITSYCFYDHSYKTYVIIFLLSGTYCIAGFSVQIRLMHRRYTSYPYDMLLGGRRTDKQAFSSETIYTDFWCIIFFLGMRCRQDNNEPT